MCKSYHLFTCVTLTQVPQSKQVTSPDPQAVWERTHMRMKIRRYGSPGGHQQHNHPNNMINTTRSVPTEHLTQIQRSRVTSWRNKHYLETGRVGRHVRDTCTVCLWSKLSQLVECRVRVMLGTLCMSSYSFF